MKAKKWTVLSGLFMMILTLAAAGLTRYRQALQRQLIWTRFK